MKPLSYTTRIVLGYITLSMIAAALGTTGTYRIRASLNAVHSQLKEGNHRLSHAIRLDQAAQKRAAAERRFTTSGGRNYQRTWEQADREFSAKLHHISEEHLQGRAALLAKIARENRGVKTAWLDMKNKRAPGANRGNMDFDYAQATERLNRGLDELVKSSNLMLAADENQAVADADWTILITLIISGLVLALAAGMAVYITSTLRKPLADLLSATKGISQGRLNPKLKIDRRDEIGALAKAFTEMGAQLSRKETLINRQLTELTDTKNQLELYSRDLELKNKEMESFIYSVSHDLKSPLIAIQGFLTMFSNEFSSTLSEKALFYLNRVQANGQHMQTLIQQLLELSRAGQVVGQFSLVDTKSLIDRILEELHHQIGSKGATIKVTGKWPTIVAEPIRIKQAISNLIENSLHYDCPDRRLQIQVGVEETADFWRFYVQDNGVGIAPQLQEKVFDVFERLTGSQEKNANGTGIGLAIVKRIAECHGGGVYLESEENRGSTFFFEIAKGLFPNEAVMLGVCNES